MPAAPAHQSLNPTQAGGHPAEASTSFEFNSRALPFGLAGAPYARLWSLG
jgi:hypothetical protein